MINYEINATGIQVLETLLETHIEGYYNLDAWVDVIQEALDNREEGESLKVELRGLKTSKGCNVFFNGVIGETVDAIEIEV